MSTVSPIRVLVVELNEDPEICLTVPLRDLGHAVEVFQKGETALREAPGLTPDAAFIDLSMPLGDELKVARRFRKVARRFRKATELHRTHLVAVSSEPRHQRQATESGFDDFLGKPCELQQLQAIVARARGKTDASSVRSTTLRSALQRSVRMVQRSRQALDEHWSRRRALAGKPSVLIERFGISNVVSVSQMPDAEELHSWLTGHDCRLGPVFEPAPGQFAFFAHSPQHHIRELIAKHGGFCIARVGGWLSSL